MTGQIESPPSSQDEKECTSGQGSRSKESERPKQSHRAFTDEEVKAIFEYIENRGKGSNFRIHGKEDINVHRNALLVSLGIYGGLSFVEMVSLRVGDLIVPGGSEKDVMQNAQWVPKEKIVIKNHKKTALSREVFVHPILKNSIERYVSDEIRIYGTAHLNPLDIDTSLKRYVFYSQQCLSATRPVSYYTMRNIFLEFERALGLGSDGGKVGIHSLKKTLQTRISDASGHDVTLTSKWKMDAKHDIPK